MKDDIISTVIGNEYDNVLLKKLNTILTNAKAISVESQQLIAGSQDYTEYEILFNGEQLRIEIETYIGITLTGKKTIITSIQESLEKEN